MQTGAWHERSQTKMKKIAELVKRFVRYMENGLNEAAKVDYHHYYAGPGMVY